MERQAYKQLLDWKNNPRRKPLILSGARQVGKTWLLKEFGKREYRNCIYINFEYDLWAQSLFVQDYNIDRILLQIQGGSGQSIKAGETLLIFDELQEVPRGLSVLKYFQENAPEQHVVVAGSLLGLAMHQQQSFPVGKVDMLTIYPLSFLEFLYALGENIKADMLKQCQWDVISGIGTLYKDLLRLYYFVGGMPEAVLEFINTQDLKRVRSIQQHILNGYKKDISKHASATETERIMMVLNSLPAQLAKENKKFIYGVLKEGARAKDFEIAIQWLIDAGIIYKIPRISTPSLPIRMYEDLNAFKIYMVDCGLLACLTKISLNIMMSGEIFSEWKGSFSEQFVLQQIIAMDTPIGYWSSNNSQCEIDFLIQGDNRVVPIEVKAEENVRSQSFVNFITKLYPEHHLKGVRCSMQPYINQSWMENVPLYAVEPFFTLLTTNHQTPDTKH